MIKKYIIQAFQSDIKFLNNNIPNFVQETYCNLLNDIINTNNFS